MIPRRFLALLVATFCASLALPAIASASHIQGGSINARLTTTNRLQGTVTFLTAGGCTVGQNAPGMPSVQVVSPSTATATITLAGTYTRCLPGSTTATANFDADLTTLFGGSAPDGAYTLNASQCCRVAGILNVANSSSAGTSFSARVTKNGLAASASPVFNSNVANTIPKGYNFSQNVNAVDPDGSAVTTASRAGETGGPDTDLVSIAANGVVSMTSAQTSTYNNGDHIAYMIRATDANGDYSTRDVLLAVSGNNAPPSIHGLPGQAINAVAGSTQAVNFTADDPNNASPKIDTVSLALSAGAPNWVSLSGTPGNPTIETLTVNPGSAVAAGDYSFNIDAIDSDSTAPLFDSKTVTVHVSHDPPTTTLANPVIAGSDATFTFGTGTNGSTFECQLDGGAWAACTSPQSYTGIADGAHTFSVRAVNSGIADASPETYNWGVDVTAPAVPAVSAAPSELAQVATFVFGIDADATAECQLDGGDWLACASPFTPAGLADGAHTVAIRSVDAAGNRSAAATSAWTLDTTAPTAPAFTSGPVGASTSKSASFDWTSEPGASFECRVDGGAWVACAAPYALTGLTTGKHSFAVRQTDAAGNVSTAGVNAWTVGEDAAPATPQAVTPVLGQGATVAVKGDAASVGCQVDGGRLASCLVDVYAHITGGGEGFGLSKATAASSGLVKIGTGRVTARKGARRLAVDITLNAIGRKLMATKLAGVPVVLKIDAKTIEGPRLKVRKNAKLVPAHQLIVPTEGLFASGKAKIQPKAAQLLRTVAKQLGKVKAIRCIGHTDSIGTTAANEKLGYERARAVCAALRKYGVRTSMSVGSRLGSAIRGRRTPASVVARSTGAWRYRCGTGRPVGSPQSADGRGPQSADLQICSFSAVYRRRTAVLKICRSADPCRSADRGLRTKKKPPPAPPTGASL